MVGVVGVVGPHVVVHDLRQAGKVQQESLSQPASCPGLNVPCVGVPLAIKWSARVGMHLPSTAGCAFAGCAPLPTSSLLRPLQAATHPVGVLGDAASGGIIDPPVVAVRVINVRVHNCAVLRGSIGAGKW